MPGSKDPSSVSTLHFDLSHAPQDAEHTLYVAGKKYQLNRHTAETRKRHVAKNQVLRAVPPDQHHRISHFTEEVRLPDTAALMFVQHASQDPKSPLPALSLLALHIPARARAAHRAKKQAAPARRLADGKPALMAAASPSDVADDAFSYKTPLDMAIALAAMHPELMHLDPEVAAHIHDNHVASAPGINELALSISQQGSADTDGGWATITPCVDENGTLLTN